MEDARSRRIAAEELNRAADDLDEHHARTTRHIIPSLDAGCWPGALFQPLFYSITEQKVGRRTLRPVAKREDADEKLRMIFDRLRVDASRAAARALAEDLGTTIAKLRSNLETSWSKGGLHYGSHPHVAHHEHLRILTDEEWDELQRLVSLAWAVDKSRVRHSAVEAAVTASSAEFVHRLSNGKLAPWCEACGSRMRLKTPSDPHNNDADRWQCERDPTHIEYHPRLAVRDALRYGPPPKCPTCGAIMEYGPPVRVQGYWWSEARCPECGRVNRSNHEQDPRRIRQQEKWEPDAPLAERRLARRPGAPRPDRYRNIFDFDGDDDDGAAA